MWRKEMSENAEIELRVARERVEGIFLPAYSNIESGLFANGKRIPIQKFNLSFESEVETLVVHIPLRHVKLVDIRKEKRDGT